MNDEQFLRLTTLYLENAIDDRDLDSLNRTLANSPDRVRQFNDLRLLAGLIHEHGRAVESCSEADLETNSPEESRHFDSPLGGSGPNTSSRFHPSRRATAITLAVLAAAASLLLVLNWPDTAPQRDNVNPAIAKLAYTSHARWGSGERALGDGFGKGKLHLEVGLARLDFVMEPVSRFKGLPRSRLCRLIEQS